MPSGRVHLRIETAALAVWAAFAFVLLRRGLVGSGTVGAFLVGYVVSMLLLSPDLDLRRSRPTRRWGVASVLWLPYSAFFRHRRLSHHLVLGPLTRIAYLLLLTALVLGLLRILGHRPAATSPLPWPSIGAAVAGMYLPNLTHVLVDRLASACVFRRSRKAKL